MNSLLNWLRNLEPLQAAAWLLLENVAVFAACIAAGYVLIALFKTRRVTLPPARLQVAEIFYTVSTILLNTLVTLVGWWLWRDGRIVVRADWSWRAFADAAILFLVMDAAMYALHRVAHFARIFPTVHSTHHEYDKPHPLSLFVLNPLEALSFGGLWLLLISVYSVSWLGMAIYLTLNVAFGTVGHLGVEPLPDGWKRWPLLSLFSTSTFHAQHHQDRDHNFGFYTLIWDKIFGTLSPRYDADFGRVSNARPEPMLPSKSHRP
jgi:lathosterol oxidase